MLTYDEESAEANSVNIYKIDLNTNRFRKEVSNNEKAYKFANDKETAFIKELYPITHHRPFPPKTNQRTNDGLSVRQTRR
jgi:hypothetical protein